MVVVFALLTWVCLCLSCVILVDFLFLASSVLVCFVVFLVGIISVAVCVLECFRLAATDLKCWQTLLGLALFFHEPVLVYVSVTSNALPVLTTNDFSGHMQ